MILKSFTGSFINVVAKMVFKGEQYNFISLSGNEQDEFGYKD